MRIFIMVMILMQGCTTFTYTAPDGKEFVYRSSKDQTITIKKTWDGYKIEINADNEAKEVAESIAKGAVKGFKRWK